MTSLIPAPSSVGAPGGRPFVLDEDTEIEAGRGAAGVARWLRTTVGAATGLPLEPYASGTSRILLRIAPSLADELGSPEAYRLTVDEHTVVIDGAGREGLFYGAQTFRQLLGPAAFRRAPVTSGRAWEVPPVTIGDAPDSAGAASCSTWPGTSCPRTGSCATST